MSKLRIFIVKSIIAIYLLCCALLYTLILFILLYKLVAISLAGFQSYIDYIHHLFDYEHNFFDPTLYYFSIIIFIALFCLIVLIIFNHKLRNVLFWPIYLSIKYFTFNINNEINPGIAVKRDDSPALYNILDELKLATNLKIPINIYTKYSSYAYSYLFRYKHYCNLVLSSQLLMSLNRNEVQAVISYELAHLIDNNIEILESISKLCYICQGFSLILSYLIFIIKASIKNLVYVNDATSIHITKNPDSLKSALKSIREINREALGIAIPDAIANISITNPNESSKNDIVHPPTSRRIFIIDKIKGSSYSLDVYNQAYKNATGKSIKKVLTKLPVIAYSPAIYSDNTKLLTEESAFYVTIIRSTKGYIPYVCKCALKMSIPAEYCNQYHVCPKCNTMVILPNITFKDIKYMKEKKKYRTIKCKCGKYLSISSAYIGNTITCKHCGRTIKIEN